MLYFDKRVQVFRRKLSPSERLEELDDHLRYHGWQVADMTKALTEIDRADGMIEIKASSGD